MLTQEILKSLLIYKPDTGEFLRKTSPARRTKIGDIAGSVDGRGYINIVVNYKKYKAHILAWLYMTGSFPTVGIDHKNRIKMDNRWTNLRGATNSENNLNKGPNKNNACGFKGVCKHGKKWRVQCMIRGVKYNLGSHLTPEEAAEEYKKFAKEKQGDFYGLDN